jgi:hypothetical protein
VAIVYWFTLHFSHNFLNRISNLRPNGWKHAKALQF